MRYADAHLTPCDEKTIDGVVYRITRWAEGGFFVKRIVMDDGGAGSLMQHLERVARCTLGDFDRMFATNGLAIEEVYGNYQLGPYDAQTSPRMILVARKAAGRLGGTRRLFSRGSGVPADDVPASDPSRHEAKIL